MADVKKADIAKEALFRKAGVVKRVLETPDGKELYDILRREFFGSMKGKDEHETIFKAGQADVVAYLTQMRDLTPEGR